MGMQEKDDNVCPKDGVTPQCEDHPDYCPAGSPKSYSYHASVSLEGTYVPDERLPEKIQRIVRQGRSIKSVG